jgi:hypothetical protein
MFLSLELYLGVFKIKTILNYYFYNFDMLI